MSVCCVCCVCVLRVCVSHATVSKCASPRGSRLPLDHAAQHIVQVALGGCHTTALASDGGVFTWGWGDRAQLGQGLPSGFMDGAAGASASPQAAAAAAAAADPDADTTDGSTDSPHPKRLRFNYDTSFTPGVMRGARLGQRIHIVQVASGDDHTLALSNHAITFSWGTGACGQLGHGGTANEWAPRQLMCLNGRGVKQVQANGAFSFAVTTRGAVWSWGSGALLGHDAVTRDGLHANANAAARARDPKFAAVSQDLQRFPPRDRFGDRHKLVSAWYSGLRDVDIKPSLTTAEDRWQRPEPAAMRRLKVLAAQALEKREPVGPAKRCVVCGVWCVVCGVWCVVCGVWCVVCGWGMGCDADVLLVGSLSCAHACGRVPCAVCGLNTDAPLTRCVCLPMAYHV